ncbi:uncharacterized protein LY79DRAFT_594970 [Colletotrichum navitas]|uniref:Uncharacterized protein n=1 Tax=Colletotrichum navitas TaxID=681940 RepID=A0AAD8PKR5_9PEZI|nr:uncharacterized protein LY79DRAFT_594970 [Colletotrichum navitas]KAK1566352.1 hypothetical protein LY79DRAFT_594970 [Colletotrichum navitas]
MAAQATESTAQPTLTRSEPHSEPEHSNQMRDHEGDQQSQRRQPRPKTGTEEKIAKETPPLNLDAPASGLDVAQRDPDKHAARRSKQTAVARAEYRNGSERSHQPQNEHQVAPQNRQVDNKSKGGAPSVRLDMDLDVDIDLKAKIKGDIELSILGGKQSRR